MKLLTMAGRENATPPANGASSSPRYVTCLPSVDSRSQHYRDEEDTLTTLYSGRRPNSSIPRSSPINKGTGPPNSEGHRERRSECYRECTRLGSEHNACAFYHIRGAEPVSSCENMVDVLQPVDSSRYKHIGTWKKKTSRQRCFAVIFVQCSITTDLGQVGQVL